MADKIEFGYRATEVTRLEAFSDVIFGFALSLIVISLEVPKTYGALIETMKGILPFSFCFLIFIGLWFQHHEFFRRYALQDKTTVWLNVALLFVILFYVYPLNLSAFAAIRLAGPVYFLLFIPKTAIPWILGVKRRRLEEALSTP